MRLFRNCKTLLLGLAAALAAVSCATRQEASGIATPQAEAVSPAPAETPAPIAEAAPEVAPVPPPKPEAPVLTLDDYKRAVARRIAESSGGHWFEGPPPPMLKSVVVLGIAIDEQGRLARVHLVRGNGHRALEALAMQSLREAQPLPRPGHLARRGLAEFSETWLFREDGRFQLRSTAEAQADS